MSEQINREKTPHRREYHKQWKTAHPERVIAAQLRYWTRQAERLRGARMELNCGTGGESYGIS